MKGNQFLRETKSLRKNTYNSKGLFKAFIGVIFGLSKGTEKISVPDNSAGGLFGMVKT